VLDEFVIANRYAIIARAQARVATRTEPKPTSAEMKNGIPVFLDQLGDALRLAKSSDDVTHDDLRKTATRHGADLFRIGLTVAQVVRDYGDVCQAITELAVEQRAPIPPDEFRTLNLCLDDAVAAAVTEYAEHGNRAHEHDGTERLGILAHELRNYLSTAMLSFESIKSGQVPPGGSTGLMLGRSLMGLRDLVDRSLAEVRLDAGIKRLQPISVAAFVEEMEISAMLQSQSRAIRFTVTTVDATVTVDGDRQILASAISNLIQNAFKFTPAGGHVSLTARATHDRVFFDVADECGGLPPGRLEELFLPFEQRGADRTGVGLGLAICMRAAKANGGELNVKDLPGKGCIYTLDMPRRATPPLTVITPKRVA
jgi:signal transduction histidine kinase